MRPVRRVPARSFATAAHIPLAASTKLFGAHKLKRAVNPELGDLALRRTMIYGYGNHIWPRARVSAGLLVVSSWVKSLGLQWKRNELLQLDIAEAPRIVFARPTCYLPENSFKTVNRVLSQYSLSPKELVFVYPDETVRVLDFHLRVAQLNSNQAGQWKEVSAGGGADAHLLCKELSHYLSNDESFTRIGVGVGKVRKEAFVAREISSRAPADWNESYMRLKPPPPHYRTLLAAASHIHHAWNTRYEAELAEIRKALAADAVASATAPVKIEAERTIEQLVDEQINEMKALHKEVKTHIVQRNKMLQDSRAK